MSDIAERRWSRRLRAGRGPEYWRTHTQDMIDAAQHARGAQVRATLGRLAYWSEYSATQDPDIIEPTLFATFVEQFGRVAGNYGGVDGTDVERALDGLIDLQRSRGQPTSRLWLAKADLRSKISLEDGTRQYALERAIAEADVGSEVWADAILAQAWYLIDVSLYDRAVDVAERLRTALGDDLFVRRYRCGYHTMSGIALLTSFRDTGRARWHLEQACRYEHAERDDQQIRRWVASAHHYLGRLAEFERRYRPALEYYVHGQELQERCPEELPALAFVHLRMSEPLVALGAFGQAEDHLNLALSLLAESAEYTSARLQTQLGFAVLRAARGDVDTALRDVDKIRAEARSIVFWRGELLCLGYRATLLIRSRRVGQLPICLWEIVRTMRGGELSRNSVVRLLAKLPTVVGIALRRMTYRPMPRGVAVGSGDRSCVCAVHTIDR